MRFGFSNTSASSALTRVISIVSNVNDYNLYNALIATGWDGTKRLKVFVTINSGVTVGSTSTSTPAFTVGNLRDTDYVEIINNGNIFGAGGLGGAGGVNSNGGPGSVGGTAIKTNSNIIISNNGIIAGGSGGNGGGGTSISSYTYWTGQYTPSCPSGGVYFASGGTCGQCSPGGKSPNYYATCTPIYATGYTYPNGSAGANGTAGAGLNGTVGPSPYYSGGAGGLAGFYYEGLNKITTLITGTVRGRTSA